MKMIVSEIIGNPLRFLSLECAEMDFDQRNEFPFREC